MKHYSTYAVAQYLSLQVDQQHVIIDYKGGKVTCSDDALRTRVEKAMQRLTEAMNPIKIDNGT